MSWLEGSSKAANLTKAIFAAFARALLPSSSAFARTFGKISPNLPVSLNSPCSPLSPKALAKFCQICHFHVPLRAFLDISEDNV